MLKLIFSKSNITSFLIVAPIIPLLVMGEFIKIFPTEEFWTFFILMAVYVYSYSYKLEIDEQNKKSEASFLKSTIVYFIHYGSGFSTIPIMMIYFMSIFGYFGIVYGILTIVCYTKVAINLFVE